MKQGRQRNLGINYFNWKIHFDLRINLCFHSFIQRSQLNSKYSNQVLTMCLGLSKVKSNYSESHVIEGLGSIIAQLSAAACKFDCLVPIGVMHENSLIFRILKHFLWNLWFLCRKLYHLQILKRLFLFYQSL